MKIEILVETIAESDMLGVVNSDGDVPLVLRVIVGADCVVSGVVEGRLGTIGRVSSCLRTSDIAGSWSVCSGLCERSSDHKAG